MGMELYDIIVYLCWKETNSVIFFVTKKAKLSNYNIYVYTCEIF